jgi:hypothetical protein
MTPITTHAESLHAAAKPRVRPLGSWWARSRPVLLVIIAIAFIAFALPPYLTLDPSRSRIPAPPDVQAYYPLLVAHVVFASIAMLSACL